MATGSFVALFKRIVALQILPQSCLMALAVLMILSGSAQASDLVPRACSFGRVVSGWQGNVTCHTLTVLEDRSHPDARSIALAVYTIEAHGPSQDPPLIYLGGGPGMSAEYYVNILLRHPIREDRAIVILEQRGIGASGEICPRMRRDYYRRAASRRSNDLRQRQYIGLLRRCFEDARRDGRAIDAYTTTENAADVADLRAALALETIDIWAVSYGTILAQAYMRLEEDRIGTLVFDATVPIDHPLGESLAGNLRRVLDAYWQDCLGAGECNEGDASYIDRLLTLIPDYNAAPLRLIGFSPEQGVTVTYVYVTGNDVTAILFALLYQRTDHRQIDRLLGLLERRSSSFLRAYYQRLVIPGFSYGMHYAVNCRGSFLDEAGATAAIAADPDLANAFELGFFAALCPASGLTPPEAGVNDAVSYSGRALILSGDRDPITPLRLAEPLRERFPNAGFLEIQGGGHGPSRDIPCAQEIVRAYFAAPDAPVIDLCALVISQAAQ